MDKITELRTMHPKRFALARIGVAMDDVKHYAASKNCNRAELRTMVSEVSAKIKDLCTRYGVSKGELCQYLAFHNYSLSF